MWGLIIYVTFVIIGAIVSALIGYFVEQRTSSGVGLIVFLSLFFANFVLYWLATVLAIDRSLGNLFAKSEQIEAERIGKEAMR
jgi:F0F1-type ATP synthase assembly protein I